MINENSWSPVGLTIARQVLCSDIKTTAADINFLVIAAQEARAGRNLPQADRDRASALYNRALWIAQLSIIKAQAAKAQAERDRKLFIP
jgi:hypothetical protein